MIKIEELEHNRRHGQYNAVTVGVEASALANWVPVLDVLPPAPSKRVRPVVPKKKKTIKQLQAVQNH